MALNDRFEYDLFMFFSEKKKKKNSDTKFAFAGE